MEGNARLDELVTASIALLCSTQDQETHSAAQARKADNEATEEKETKAENEKGKSSKKLRKCPICGIDISKLSNLKRHITRKHGNSPMPESLNTGKTTCLECKAQFRRTTELILHLESEHKMEFQIETLTFQNLEGRLTVIIKCIKLF